MTTELALFYAFATILVGAALAVITVKNTVHSVLFLVLTFFSSACVWLLAHAEFLAIALVLVYVGAVMVLFLFVVMMLDIKTDSMREGFARYLPVAVVVAALMLVQMLAVIGANVAASRGAPVADAAAALGQSNIQWLGRALFTEYLLPFEIAAVILTVAIIAAIALTLRHRVGGKKQDPSRQVQVRKEDRLRVLKMPSSGNPSSDKGEGA